VARIVLQMADGSAEHFNVDDESVGKELLNLTNRTGRFQTPWIQVASSGQSVKYVQYSQIVSVSAKLD